MVESKTDGDTGFDLKLTMRRCEKDDTTFSLKLSRNNRNNNIRNNSLDSSKKTTNNYRRNICSKVTLKFAPISNEQRNNIYPTNFVQ